MTLDMLICAQVYVDAAVHTDTFTKSTNAVSPTILHKHGHTSSHSDRHSLHTDTHIHTHNTRKAVLKFITPHTCIHLDIVR